MERINVTKKRGLHPDRWTLVEELHCNLIQPTSSDITHTRIQMGNVKDITSIASTILLVMMMTHSNLHPDKPCETTTR
jgi:hypothetical protein